ncbi:MAG: hypothetical protein J2P16_08755 [Mycobacterium sp.]|nr:hypothetical protein [Mycobacterium sp.]
MNRDDAELVPVSQARLLIDRAVLDENVEALLELRRRADAVGLYHRRRDARETANDAGEIKVRAERGLGQIDEKANPHGGDRRSPEVSSSVRTELELVDHQTRAVWRHFGKLRDEIFDDLVSRARADESGGVTTAAVDTLRRGGRHVASTSDDWYTPRWLLEQLDCTFDIDVCAPEDPDARTVPANLYYTRDDDGLAQPWDGLVWCNPPYSEPTPWIERWIDHDNGMLLTHVSVGSTRMPLLWRAAHGIILMSRMEFERPDGTIEHPYWMLQLAARGDQAVEALSRVHDTNAGPVWVVAE